MKFKTFLGYLIALSIGFLIGGFSVISDVKELSTKHVFFEVNSKENIYSYQSTRNYNGDRYSLILNGDTVIRRILEDGQWIDIKVIPQNIYTAKK